METSTQIKPMLEAMKVGEELPFPLGKRGSVRSTASNMRLDGFLFTTQMQVGENQIVVTRKK